MKKAFMYLARKEGYPKGLVGRILDIVSDYQMERKALKKDRKNKSVPDKLEE